ADHDVGGGTIGWGERRFRRQGLRSLARGEQPGRRGEEESGAEEGKSRFHWGSSSGRQRGERSGPASVPCALDRKHGRQDGRRLLSASVSGLTPNSRDDFVAQPVRKRWIRR